MSDNIMRRQMALLKNAAPERQVAVINKASAQHLLRMDANFENWAHRNQLPPRSVGWRTWLMMAGRGFGKTRAGAEWIHSLASGKPGVRVALVGATIADARSIMVEGVSGLLSIAKANKQRVTWEPSSGRLTWPNGSQAQTFSGDSPNGLRGPEFDFAWADELAKWREPEASWDNLQMALRRGQRPRVLVTTTPRPMELLERIRAGEWTVTTTGRTSQNINLDKRFIDIKTATSGGTRVGEQELDGVLFRNAEGALWTREILERARVMPGTLERVDVGGDPLTLPLAHLKALHPRDDDYGTETARSKSVLGAAVGVLGAGGAELVDDINSIDVELIDHDQWLLSCDDAALVAGSNLAMVGAELIQFGRAVPLGAGRFRLSHLLRGRGATEWASSGHAVGESFCLVDPSSLQPIALPNSAVGSTVVVAVPGATSVSALYAGEGLRPPPPVNLSAARWADSSLDLAWTRRSRLGFAWVDEIDAPLGESREQYRVNLLGVSESLELLADGPMLSIASAAVTALGSGAATIEVRQIGDFAVSRAVSITITLS